jgi:hypothetical protein
MDWYRSGQVKRKKVLVVDGLSGIPQRSLTLCLPDFRVKLLHESRLVPRTVNQGWSIANQSLMGSSFVVAEVSGNRGRSALRREAVTVSVNLSFVEGPAESHLPFRSISVNNHSKPDVGKAGKSRKKPGQK